MLLLLIIDCTQRTLDRHSCVIYSLRCNTKIILVPLVCSSCSSLLQHHLFAPLQLLLDGYQVFPVNGGTPKHLRVCWMICGRVNDRVSLVLASRLRRWGTHSHLEGRVSVFGF